MCSGIDLVEGSFVAEKNMVLSPQLQGGFQAELTTCSCLSIHGWNLAEHRALLGSQWDSGHCTWSSSKGQSWTGLCENLKPKGRDRADQKWEESSAEWGEARICGLSLVKRRGHTTKMIGEWNSFETSHRLLTIQRCFFGWLMKDQQGH